MDRIIDCHMHLDPELVSPESLIESMDAFGVEQAALIPALSPALSPTFLTRIGPPAFRRGIMSSAKMLRALMRKIYTGWVEEGHTVDVGGKPYTLFGQPDNNLVAEAMAKYPDRFMGWIAVNPGGPVSPAEEIEKYSGISGCVGVKAHPFWHDTPMSTLTEAAALCQEMGLAMLIHLGVGENGDFEILPERFPGVNFIYAHAGIPYQKAVWDYAASRKNIFVDLSSPAYVDEKIAMGALTRAGTAKCLFGSDGPYFHVNEGHYDYGVNLSMLAACGLDKQDYKLVTRDNFINAVRAA